MADENKISESDAPQGTLLSKKDIDAAINVAAKAVDSVVKEPAKRSKNKRIEPKVLNNDQIVMILQARASGVPMKFVAEGYGIPASQVKKIWSAPYEAELAPDAQKRRGIRETKNFIVDEPVAVKNGAKRVVIKKGAKNVTKNSNESAKNTKESCDDSSEDEDDHAKIKDDSDDSPVEKLSKKVKDMSLQSNLDEMRECALAVAAGANHSLVLKRGIKLLQECFGAGAVTPAEYSRLSKLFTPRGEFSSSSITRTIPNNKVSRQADELWLYDI